MNRSDLVKRVRSLTRDLTNSIFREQDIVDFLNEGIDRIMQVIPELSDMEYLVNSNQGVSLLPRQYHYLLAIYATSRCFNQDERHFQAGEYMNEFETKVEDLMRSIEGGDVSIILNDGRKVVRGDESGFVVDVYFNKEKHTFDEDDGVDGVQS